MEFAPERLYRLLPGLEIRAARGRGEALLRVQLGDDVEGLGHGPVLVYLIWVFGSNTSRFSLSLRGDLKRKPEESCLLLFTRNIMDFDGIQQD